jgi:hypothetical protein
LWSGLRLIGNNATIAFDKTKEQPMSVTMQRSFRPAVENLEGRELLTTLAPITRPALQPVQQPAITRLGNYTQAYYSAGSQHVRYFALDFQGSFTYANAQLAYTYATSYTGAAGSGFVLSGLTLSNNSQLYNNVSNSSSHHMLIGWYNADRHEGGWMASDYVKTVGYLVNSGPWWNRTTQIQEHNYMNWMVNGSTTVHYTEGWQGVSYDTNGFTVGLHMAPTSGRQIAAYFDTPYSYGE